MNWHIICLVAILSLYVNPIGFSGPSATANDPFDGSFAVTVPASRQNVNCFFRWIHWQAVVSVYAARPGRVTLCRWRLKWRWCGSFSRRRHPTKRRRSVTSGSQPAETDAQASVAPELPSEPRPTTETEKDTRVPLRLVLRPGVILTKRGIQLRPVIARLGNDVKEYRALWEDKEQFKAAIRRLLSHPCPLCGGNSGFRCIGSDRRSVIPPRSKDRSWFRMSIAVRSSPPIAGSCGPPMFGLCSPLAFRSTMFKFAIHLCPAMGCTHVQAM